jgi:AbrB family looped-hinge helix DNA binding protein
MSTTVTAKGRVTIPKAVRDHLAIGPGSRVAFQLAPNGDVVLVNMSGAPKQAGFARFRSIAGAGPSTDEIMAMTRG